MELENNQIKKYLKDIGWERKIKRQKLGSPADYYAEFKKDEWGLILLIDDGNISMLDTVYHIFNSSFDKVFEGRIESMDELYCTMKIMLK